MNSLLFFNQLLLLFANLSASASLRQIAICCQPLRLCVQLLLQLRELTRRNSPPTIANVTHQPGKPEAVPATIRFLSYISSFSLFLRARARAWARSRI